MGGVGFQTGSCARAQGFGGLSVAASPSGPRTQAASNGGQCPRTPPGGFVLMVILVLNSDKSLMVYVAMLTASSCPVFEGF